MANRTRLRRTIPQPDHRPTQKMSLEEIQVLLEIDASARMREEALERTKHTRPTIEMIAVKP